MQQPVYGGTLPPSFCRKGHPRTATAQTISGESYMQNTHFYLIDEDAPEQSIPLPTAEEEQEMSTSSVPETLPILALKNTVLFPGVVLPITVGRDASLKLVKDAFAGDKLIGVLAQRSSEIEDPDPEDLYEVGTVATILKLIKMPDGSKSIVIQGKRRFEIDEYVQEEPYFRARVQPINERLAQAEEIELQALIRSVKELAIQIVAMSPNLPSEAAYAIENIDSPAFLIHFIASNLQVEVEDKQELLQTISLVDRANLVMEHLNKEIQVLQLSEEIRSRVKTDVDQQQREYLLRQQMKAIQLELGEGNELAEELNEIREKARKAELPDNVMKEVETQIRKLERMHPEGGETAMVRSYLDWLVELPWARATEDNLDLAEALHILDEDHYGLES
ncbi:MAG TPA: LON peptidase substrate-binding domain-containing protein, partial [Rhodothermales bacterium]|nr:LON peptidase substrate-binding domain-containing protein [Rhodothermales bacterium]